MTTIQLDLFEHVWEEATAEPMQSAQVVTKAPGLAATASEVTDILGPALGSELNSLFGLMEIAEDEIAKAQMKHPDHADLVWHTFGILNCYDYPFGKRHPDVYRSHCRELINRAIAGENLGLATMAEMLIGIMHFFTFAAPGRDGGCIANHLFNVVMGEGTFRLTYERIQKANGLPTEDIEQFVPSEPWAGFIDEQLDRIRRSSRVRNDTRQKEWQERVKKVQG